jgi:hypothetical protein
MKQLTRSQKKKFAELDEMSAVIAYLLKHGERPVWAAIRGRALPPAGYGLDLEEITIYTNEQPAEAVPTLDGPKKGLFNYG